MRIGVLVDSKRVLARGAAVFLIGSLAAGCSAGGLSRFTDGTDGIFTGSTSDKPGQAQSLPAPTESARAQPDEEYAGSVAREAVTPVDVSQRAVARAELPPVPTAAPAQKPAPAVRTASLSSNEGTSARKADRLARAETAKRGDGDAKAKVPASDAEKPATKPAADTSAAAPAKKAPAPNEAPTNKAAVLPQPPRLKEGEAKPAQSTTADAKPAEGGGYTVADGDSLSRIARKTGVSVAALKEANGLGDSPLKIGQTLKVPAGDAPKTSVPEAKPAAPVQVRTVSTDAAEPAAAAKTEQVAAYTPPKKAIEQVEDDAGKAPTATGVGRMRWPVRGRVISGYGASGGAAKDGIDIQVPEGTAVKAAENGVVIYAGDGLKEFGNTVLVRHENGLVTVYGHASELNVKRGDTVKRGQEIARSGMSGSTDAPKLHFEVRKNSTPVDPSTYLE